MTSNNLLLSTVMFATGIGIPTMAAWNARLGVEIGSPWAAGFILCVGGAIITGVAMFTLGLPKNGWFNAEPLFYFSGALVAFYVLSVTWIAPRIGVANAVFFVLVGQIFAAAIIDQFGLFGAVKYPVTAQRIIGIVLMLVGTFLARRIA